MRLIPSVPLGLDARWKSSGNLPSLKNDVASFILSFFSVLLPSTKKFTGKVDSA